MKNKKFNSGLLILGTVFSMASCKAPKIMEPESHTVLPEVFSNTKGESQENISSIPWKTYFKDPYLVALIDTALKNNQELMMTLQEIEISRNEIQKRKGEILPSVGLAAGTGVEKVGRYTSQGAGDAGTEITPGRAMPDPLGDFKLSAYANWEVDIWNKLHNAKAAAVTRYLATVEGKNFVITNLIAEVADSYYELLGLDNQLEIIKQNIALQNNALTIVKLQKEASRATELAVQKFQAEVLTSKTIEFDLLQQIKETENRINFLLGRYPQEIKRDKNSFLADLPSEVKVGIPAQLLANRPDVKQAELELEAAKLDVRVARAAFYPKLDISAAIGLQAFRPSYFLKFPESILYSLAGDVAGPLINRNAIQAEFKTASAQQVQVMVNYEKVLLNAYLEVSNDLSKIHNLEQKYNLKSEQVDALSKAIDASQDLFKSARVDYFEVLMTQRDALESKLQLIETKKDQLNTLVHVYRDLGGGWQ